MRTEYAPGKPMEGCAPTAKLREAMLRKRRLQQLQILQRKPGAEIQSQELRKALLRDETQADWRSELQAAAANTTQSTVGRAREAAAEAQQEMKATIREKWHKWLKEPAQAM